jgi:hypothetical protein
VAHRSPSPSRPSAGGSRPAAALTLLLALVALLAFGAASASAAPPSATTEAATAITPTGATFNGTVNPNGLETEYRFLYGTTPFLGQSTPLFSAGSGVAPVKVNRIVTGLTEGATYYFKLSTNNKDGTTYGSVLSFEYKPTWAIQETPNPAEVELSRLKDVSCPTAGECFAVGDSRLPKAGTQPMAQRWDGSKWTLQTTPALGLAGHGLEGVSCTSTAACTAVGFKWNGSAIQVLAERWNGTEWKTQEAPSPAGAVRSELLAVSCASATECIAVGRSQSASVTTLAERWDGTTWKIMTTPNPVVGSENAMTDVHCLSASFCMAVGRGGSFTWNGTEWKNQKVAGASLLESVSCTATNACTTVGLGPSGTFAARWNGTEWTAQEVPDPVGSTATAFKGVSCPSATSCIGTGYYNDAGGNTLSLVVRWNGVWTLQSSPNPLGTAALWEVSCISPSVCTSVGAWFSEGKTKSLAERSS